MLIYDLLKEKFRIKNNKNIKYFKSIFKFKIYNSYFY